MATIEELTTPLTKDEIEGSIYQAIEAYGVKTSGWKPGGTARTIIAATSIVLAAMSTLSAEVAKSGFRELATGVWLEIVALQVYGVTKDQGTFAEGDVELSNTGGGVYAVAIGDLTVSNSTTGKSYKNTEAFTLAALETDKAVAVRAVEIGSDSTAPAGDIDTIETTLLGVTVTNAAALVGLDPETDPALRARCRAKLGTLSPNGPGDAYRYVAQTAVTSEGVPCGVTRVTTVADGAGGVTVYVATASGALTGASGDLTLPFGAVEDAIFQLAEPLAITATVINATPLAVAPTYTAWVRPSTVSPAEMEAAIAARLSTVIGSQPIGGSRKTPGDGYVFTDILRAAITAEVGLDNLIDLDLTLPAADVVVASNEAPIAGAVTATITVASL